jgi:hypothetical protein
MVYRGQSNYIIIKLTNGKQNNKVLFIFIINIQT